MAQIAHDLLDEGYPFLMEKPMGISAPEVEAVAAKAARRNAFGAVPLAQRYGPFAARARQLLAAGRPGPPPHIHGPVNPPGAAPRRAWGLAPRPQPPHGRGGWPCEPGP